jgi:peptidoglycan hydrolase CwlO-like protein
MRLKLFVAATIMVTTSIAAFAQKDEPDNQAPKPNIEEAQKLVQAITSDKTKLQAYCEIGQLQGQIDKAEQKNDSKGALCSIRKTGQPRTASRLRLHKDNGRPRGSRS